MDSAAGGLLNGTLEGLGQRLSLVSGGLCAQGRGRRARAVPIVAALPVERHSHAAPLRAQGCIFSACPLDQDTGSLYGLLITSE